MLQNIFRIQYKKGCRFNRTRKVEIINVNKKNPYFNEIRILLLK